MKNDFTNVLKLSNFFYDFKNFSKVKEDLSTYHENNSGFTTFIASPEDPFRRCKNQTNFWENAFV